jgi:hypothetical protein
MKLFRRALLWVPSRFGRMWDLVLPDEASLQNGLARKRPQEDVEWEVSFA